MEDNIDFNEISQGSSTTGDSLRSGNSSVNRDRMLKQNNNRDIDRFSQFMFGNSRIRGAKTEEVNHDLFSNGAGPNNISPNPSEDISSNKNIIELMATIDTLIETVNVYKPIINDISPLVKQIINKFKDEGGSKEAK
ncbi:hypothetical protein IHQ11_27105 [Priestia megaterium]|uniref:hypothetical protein n=1 Tax=Priestia megaterium TaxID=1404 RepID=UPI00159CA5D5|nr:hypothetical protein [Priestia megaterium]MBQ4870120.1 hypothetical protein [Priestia megaterium]